LSKETRRRNTDPQRGEDVLTRIEKILSSADWSNRPILPRPAGLKEMILTALAKTPLTKGEMTEIFGVPRASVDGRIGELCDKKLIELAGYRPTKFYQNSNKTAKASREQPVWKITEVGLEHIKR